MTLPVHNEVETPVSRTPGGLAFSSFGLKAKANLSDFARSF
jgi:hypothetical protein